MLRTQMRVRAGSDFVSYIRTIFDPLGSPPPTRLDFGDYDLRLYDDIADMRDGILQRNVEVGLSRLVAGFAWDWKTKKDKTAFDIVIDKTRLRWNSTATDWIASSNSIDEVGSIHTVQGYDLNYVGVIIGPDLGFNVQTGRLYIDRFAYADKKGKERCDDQQLLTFIPQIYAVLMTRGILGAYVYACDPGLREYLRRFIPTYNADQMSE